MPDTHPAKVDRIVTNLLSTLLDYSPEEDTWDGWVELAMNEAWDRLAKLGGPDA